MAEKQEILFGTGDLFIVPDSIDLETATEQEIQDSLFKVGESSGEASLVVEYEFADIRGGTSNHILKSVRTTETILFNAGIITYDLESIGNFLGSNYSEDATAGLKTLELGGSFQVPVKRLRFVHYKDDGYKITMDMHKATNKSGLEWTFNNEEGSPFEFEFTLMKDPAKNNIVKITEEVEPTTTV